MTPTEPTTTLDLEQLAGTWVLDPGKTTVTFRTKAMWVLPVKGRAAALRGEARVSPDGTVNGELVIDAASLDTKNKRRDEHLRSADFLEATSYPTITFTASSGRLLGADRMELSGELTVRDQTRPLTLVAEVRGAGSSATVSTDVEIDRGLWGVTWAKMGTALKNQVAVRAHFDRA